MSKVVIIVGSSRSDGNTMKIAQTIAQKHKIDVLNLSDYQFSYYDYENKNKGDDFLSLIQKCIENYDTFVFATPVYWYSMSGIMKVFFDRFSDLLTIEKELGRKLRGKKMAVLSNSAESNLAYDFYIPFQKSAEYLGMKYSGEQHFNSKTFNPNTKVELDFI